LLKTFIIQTSALDIDSETKMYNLLKSDSVLTQQHSELDDYGNRKKSLGLTYVSIGHRPTVQQYHTKQLRLLDGGYEMTDITPVAAHGSYPMHSSPIQTSPTMSDQESLL
jgi:ABC-type uncharacterized transport system fused permease/ATPase subunit